ncbi:MAG: orc1/cdc6 family replication initiation protein [Candidatus Syntrophoarchaeum caldarius]|uniref:ORC1-type DNA replication protein n=1 Tax=Candidatus Syntropharchaeum caldarium TaxID=1838285 RepID=A0A1F2P9I2_9EURY|nr:MAG: orc1/cdc6 family replication initiation protein [Candidatus Syntrophoarchaeum caldarius]
MEASIMSGIFSGLLDVKPIFKDKEVLRSTYTPDHLPHREAQIKSLAYILVSALRGNTPSNVMIYGKTGTGKTACAKFVGRELEATSAEQGRECSVIYINGGIIDTQYRIIAHLAKLFDKDVPMTGWPTDQVYAEFKATIDEREQIIIIILDEIDKLVKKGDEVLYNLLRINSDLENAKISIIGISNNLQFREFLDPRIKSSLGEEELLFPPYDARQLGDILSERAAIGFEEDVLDPAVIPLCAAFAANEHGDARRALDLMRVAGELAERAGDGMVTKEHVRKAQTKIESDRIQEVLTTLPTQSKLVLYSVMSTGGKPHLTTGEVYRAYMNCCKITGMNALTQRRVTDLISELDMLGIIMTKIANKGRYGRTKEISLAIPHSLVRSIILTDSRLKVLEGCSTPLQRTLGETWNV